MLVCHSGSLEPRLYLVPHDQPLRLVIQELGIQPRGPVVFQSRLAYSSPDGSLAQEDLRVSRSLGNGLRESDSVLVEWADLWLDDWLEYLPWYHW